MNYIRPNADEGTLTRHYLPDKDFLDANCPDGLRLELMFPSCWNGKDVDSPDHQSHVAYPSLVMDGYCPKGYEHRLVSLLFETIWATNEFKGMDGKFVLANGDPTGFGNHGDFMQGWEPGVLQEAVDECTNPSGEVYECHIFDLQSEDEQRKCNFAIPDVLKNEDVHFHDGLPGGVKIEYGPAYAFPIKYTTTPALPTAHPTESPAVFVPLDLSSVSHELSLGSGSQMIETQALAAAPTEKSTSNSTATPTPVTSYIEGPVTEVVVNVQREIVVDCDGKPISTAPGGLNTVGTSSTTVTKTVSTAVTVETPSIEKRDAVGHVNRRGRGHGYMHRRSEVV